MSAKRDYALLSLQVGLFCGKVDSYLNQSLYTLKARAHAWRLTPELLKQWQAEARLLGVPDEIFAETSEDQSRMAAALDAGLAVQDQVDRRSVH